MGNKNGKWFMPEMPDSVGQEKKKPEPKEPEKVLYELYYSEGGNLILPIQFSWNKQELDEIAEHLNAANYRYGKYYVQRVTRSQEEYDDKEREFHYYHTHN